MNNNVHRYVYFDTILDTTFRYKLWYHGIFVAESQLRMPKFAPDIMFSNMLPLVSVNVEYHAEWCALKSPSIRLSVIIIRWSREGR